VGLAVAPLVATSTLAWSLHTGAAPFPLGRCAAFLLFATLALLEVGASTLLSGRVRARATSRK